MTQLHHKAAAVPRAATALPPRCHRAATVLPPCCHGRPVDSRAAVLISDPLRRLRAMLQFLFRRLLLFTEVSDVSLTMRR